MSHTSPFRRTLSPRRSVSLSEQRSYSVPKSSVSGGSVCNCGRDIATSNHINELAAGCVRLSETTTCDKLTPNRPSSPTVTSTSGPCVILTKSKVNVEEKLRAIHLRKIYLLRQRRALLALCEAGRPGQFHVSASTNPCFVGRRRSDHSVHETHSQGLLGANVNIPRGCAQHGESKTWRGSTSSVNASAGQSPRVLMALSLGEAARVTLLLQRNPIFRIKQTMRSAFERDPSCMKGFFFVDGQPTGYTFTRERRFLPLIRSGRHTGLYARHVGCYDESSATTYTAYGSPGVRHYTPCYSKTVTTHYL